MKKLVLLLVVSMVMIFAGCSDKEESKTPEKISLTLMINDVNDPSREVIMAKVQEQFPEYNLIIKPWEGSTANQTIKTAFAAGQSLDIVRYWSTYMSDFKGTGIPLDLQAYVDADSNWKNGFVDGALEACVFEGELVSVPTTTVYPLFMVNKDIFEAAGVTIKDSMTWEEFTQVCEDIKSDTVFPLAINRDWACWFARNGLLQIWDDNATLNAFNAGEIPFTHKNVKLVLDHVTNLYKNDYVYPGGETAISTTGDEALSQFIQGGAAIYPNVNVKASEVTKAIDGNFEVGIVSWPNMNAHGDMYYSLGAATGLFVMSNTKHPEESIEVLKYLTSLEIDQIRADHGAILPKKGISSNDPNFALYGLDSDRIYPTEIINLSQKIADYIVYNTPSSYIYHGDASIEELEALRLEALEQ